MDRKTLIRLGLGGASVLVVLSLISMTISYTMLRQTRDRLFDEFVHPNDSVLLYETTADTANMVGVVLGCGRVYRVGVYGTALDTEAVGDFFESYIHDFHYAVTTYVELGVADPARAELDPAKIVAFGRDFNTVYSVVVQQALHYSCNYK